MSDSPSKFGRLTPDQWGTTMPAHNPAYRKGPWYYRDTEAIMLTYLTDEDAFSRQIWNSSSRLPPGVDRSQRPCAAR